MYEIYERAGLLHKMQWSPFSPLTPFCASTSVKQNTVITYKQTKVLQNDNISIFKTFI